MENYMPVEVFEEIKDGQLDDWINAYYHLDENQKDFFNISVGFSKKNNDGSPRINRENLNIDIFNLYSDVSDANYDILNKGLRLADFKNEFPIKFVQSHNVYRDTLLARTMHQDNKNELEDILAKIYELL